MKKKITKIIVAFLLIPVILISPLMLFYGVFFAGLPVVYIAGQIERNQIRDEVFEYVLENHAVLEQSISGGYKNFVHETTGLAPTASSEYGYFYSTSNNYGEYGYRYKNGYRMDAYLDDDFDWYYEEQICENWYYYEIHDG